MKGGAARGGSFVSAGELAACALMTALLIGGQLALSSAAGVEVVTVMLLAFCTVYGRRAGMLTATAFSLLRCILFGFFPSVVALYLIYYNAFAFFFGSFQKRRPHLLFLVLFAVAFTACFTLLDDVLYPLFSGIRGRVWRLYVAASLPVMAAQCVCALATVSLLYLPLERVFSAACGAGRSKRGDKKILQEPQGRRKAARRADGVKMYER